MIITKALHTHVEQMQNSKVFESDGYFTGYRTWALLLVLFYRPIL